MQDKSNLNHINSIPRKLSFELRDSVISCGNLVRTSRPPLGSLTVLSKVSWEDIIEAYHEIFRSETVQDMIHNYVLDKQLHKTTRPIRKCYVM